MIQLLSASDNVISHTTLHNQYHYSPQITHHQLLSWNYDCSVHHLMYDWRLYHVDDAEIQNNVPIPIHMISWETSTCRLLHDMYWCSSIILPWCCDVTWYVVCLVSDISYTLYRFHHDIIELIHVPLLLLQCWHMPECDSADHIDLWDWERERERDWNTLQVHVFPQLKASHLPFRSHAPQ